MNEANGSKFMARKCNIFNDNSNVKHVLGNEINYNTEVLKSNFYDYNGAYNLLRGDINVTQNSNSWNTSNI